jgi:hypothetical protein
MQRTQTAVVIVLALTVALIQGCAHYKITQHLSYPLERKANTCMIGEVTESLPENTEFDKRPPMEDIQQFENYLKEELDEVDIFKRVLVTNDEPAEYLVTGNILGYSRGSGATRFFIGFGLGNAKITIELKLIDVAADEIVFAGNFNREVSSGLESGMGMYRRVAEDFAKALNKQLKKLEKD